MATYSSNTTIKKYSQSTNSGILGGGISTLFTIPAGCWAKGKIMIGVPYSGSTIAASVYLNGVLFMSRIITGVSSASGSISTTLEFDIDNVGDDVNPVTLSASSPFSNYIYSVTLFTNSP